MGGTSKVVQVIQSIHVQVQEITVRSVSQPSNVRPLIESGLCAQCVDTVQCVGKLPTRVATGVFLDPDT